MKKILKTKRILKIFLASTIIFITSCRKTDLSKGEIFSKQDEYQKFFSGTDNLNQNLKGVVASLKKQQQKTHFLESFISKNGVPVWEKVLQKVSPSRSNAQKGQLNMSDMFNSNTANTAGSSGMYLIPLREENSSTIKSYIACYQHGDSLFSYKLYNKDSLTTSIPKNSETKAAVVNALGVLAYFEKTINNQQASQYNLSDTEQIEFKNPNISLTASSDASNPKVNSIGMTLDGPCNYSVTITETYSEVNVYLNGVLVYHSESYSVGVVAVFYGDCSGGGSGPGGDGNNNGGDWFNWGTGYNGDPYWNNYNFSGWLYPWWTSGGGGGYSGDYDPDFDPSTYPETIEILAFETDYRTRMSFEETQIFDNMSRTSQLQYLFNAKEAETQAKLLYPTSVHNGNGDAFRHALFNALNAKVLGVGLAMQLANAHEQDPRSVPLESQMDLWNNQIGRDLYVSLLNQGQAGHFYKEVVMIKLRQMIQNGGLLKLDPLGANDLIIPGVTQLVPTN